MNIFPFQKLFFTTVLISAVPTSNTSPFIDEYYTKFKKNFVNTSSQLGTHILTSGCLDFKLGSGTALASCALKAASLLIMRNVNDTGSVNIDNKSTILGTVSTKLFDGIVKEAGHYDPTINDHFNNVTKIASFSDLITYRLIRAAVLSVGVGSVLYSTSWCIKKIKQAQLKSALDNGDNEKIENAFSWNTTIDPAILIDPNQNPILRAISKNRIDIVDVLCKNGVGLDQAFQVGCKGKKDSIYSLYAAGYLPSENSENTTQYSPQALQFLEKKRHRYAVETKNALESKNSDEKCLVKTSDDTNGIILEFLVGNLDQKKIIDFQKKAIGLE